jgi:hypothetical protein
MSSEAQATEFVGIGFDAKSGITAPRHPIVTQSWAGDATSTFAFINLIPVHYQIMKNQL